MSNLSTPIALRRTRRSISALAQCAEAQQADELIVLASSASKTPKRSGRLKKRVRFSDPGPSLEDDDGVASAFSTGLTPMIRRTSLAKPLPKRRHSTPARAASGRGPLGGSSPFSTETDHPGSPLSGEMHFLPLRQVLDGRVKRRIRRNGLSEEMNIISAEKKRREKERCQEIARLRAELAAKDEEIQRLQDGYGADDTLIQDTDRILELEQHVETLRTELAERSGTEEGSRLPHHDWTMAARDPYAEDCTMLDPSSDGIDVMEDFGDTTMADLACSTPSRRTARMRNSFPTPPSTSPTAMPMTPCSHLLTPKSHAGVQVDFGDPKQASLEDEIASLQLEICKLTTTLESYSAMTSRMLEKLTAFAPIPEVAAGHDAAASASSQTNADLEANLYNLLQTLADKTAALDELNASLGGLGFPGSDGGEVIAAITSTFRTARLELEYLTPGEISLPLSSPGARVLDLVLERLRDLARKGREADDAIDEYHELELSLRKQLGSRADAMDGMAGEVEQLRGDVKTRDERVAELEVGLDRLKGAARTYSRDITELEALVQRMERDLDAAVTDRAQLRKDVHTRDDELRARDAAAAEKDLALAALEERMGGTVRESEGLREQLRELQETHGATEGRLAELNQSHGSALALRDARVAELRGQIERVNEALRAAHESIRQLRVEKGALEGRVGEEKSRAKAVIDSMREELERVVRMSQDFLMANTPRKKKKDGPAGEEARPETTPERVAASAGLLFTDVVQKSGGKMRRRYDSGLGFLDEEDVDV